MEQNGMRERVIALVDCDSFYVSCEVKDKPELQDKPVCVLTSSGMKGIVVSRSKAAKTLGIKMGAPYFQIKDVYKDVIFISSRMHRYSVISEQVMSCLKQFSPEIEVTSIDEAFIDLTGLDKLWKKSYTNIISEIKAKIWEEIHIPVSIGVSSSKILAKLASDKAKTGSGVFIIEKNKIKELVGDVDIEEVSGIGNKNAQKLKFYGIYTINDFVCQDNMWIKKVLGFNGLILKQELLGTTTSYVNAKQVPPQSIQDTKSFEYFTSDLEFLKGALNNHIHCACQKLRKYNGYTSSVEVILKTKDFKLISNGVNFSIATNSDFEIRKYAYKLLNSIYRPNILYRSVGIVLKNLSYGEIMQNSLFGNLQRNDDKLSRVIDNLEDKFGVGIVKTLK